MKSSPAPPGVTANWHFLCATHTLSSVSCFFLSLESITATGGTTTITNYGYEPHRDLKTSVANLAGGALVSSYTYTYDSLGRRQDVANTGSAFAGPAFSIYGYNARNELTDSGRYLGTDATDLSVPVADEHRAYIYDSIGNRLTAESGLGAGRERIDYESNALNQYELITGGALTNPSYDEDGNLTGYDKAGTRVQLVFNGENRLRVIAPVTPAPGAMKAEFVYDYLGRRVQKRILSWNGSNYQPTAIGLFIYDGWNLLEERDESGASRSHYVYGLDLSGTLQGAGSIGGLVAGIDHGLGVVHHYFYDASGNVVQLVDGSDGSVTASYEYGAYGTIVSSSGSFAGSNPFRFSTKYLDSETGLYYYGYRYYSPELGRWVSRDPLGEEGGVNTLAIAGNDLINNYDLFGLFWEWARNGTSAHNAFFKWLEDTHPDGKEYKYDRALGTLGLSISLNRPDVIDLEQKLVWELKPISHMGGTPADYLQLTKYTMETGLCPGDPKHLVPSPGTKAEGYGRSYGIIDYNLNYRDLYLTPGQHGFVYYKLGPPEPTKVKRVAKETAEDLANVAAFTLAVTGTVITTIVVGGH
jgi:RHS repeat-associated protein